LINSNPGRRGSAVGESAIIKSVMNAGMCMLRSVCRNSRELGL
jgi:hypothetical protein